MRARILPLLAAFSSAACLSRPDVTNLHADAVVYTYPDAEDPDPDALGFMDAELDGGVLDTGARDIGFNDGAPIDVGTPPDSGGPDAMVADLGSPDLGVPDTGPRDPLMGVGALTRINYGLQIPEGPTWRPDNTLVFTDIATQNIYQTQPPNYSPVNILVSSDDAANGLANAPNGDLFACQHNARRVARYQFAGMSNTVSAFADHWQGHLFNSPNDLVVRADGFVYFTDPPYGLRGRPREIPFNGLFSVSSTGAVTAEWRGQAMTATLTDSLPNGVDLSPDEHTLYMSDSASSIVHAFDVLPNGHLSNERTLFRARGNAADGIGIDVDGNLWVATSSGVEVWSSQARYWGLLRMPAGITPGNIQFGGTDRRTAYIAGRNIPGNTGSIYWVTVTIPGAH
ncbi:MAG: SMP-30/gluconolactonase/LRE family protein [Myxococcota bacterium]